MTTPALYGLSQGLDYSEENAQELVLEVSFFDTQGTAHVTYPQFKDFLDRYQDHDIHGFWPSESLRVVGDYMILDADTDAEHETFPRDLGQDTFALVGWDFAPITETPH